MIIGTCALVQGCVEGGGWMCRLAFGVVTFLAGGLRRVPVAAAAAVVTAGRRLFSHCVRLHVGALSHGMVAYGLDGLGYFGRAEL